MNLKTYMIMKTYPKILLLLVLCLVATSASARKKPRQIVSNDTVYVKPYEMPNAGYYLPAPPDTASMDFIDDMIQWQWGKTQRNTPRGRQANMESPWEPYIMESIMSQCLGLDTICAEKTPALARFLKRAYNTGNKSTAAAKALYMRTRPFVQMGEDTWAKYDTEYLRTNGSYPSGHTSLGWGTALAFAEMWPELQDTIMRRAFQFGENRIITGAHYQSDVTAGYLCASAAYVRAHLHPEFQQDIEAARAEYKKLKGLPADYDPTALAGLPQGCKILNPPVDTASYRYEGDLFRYWKAKQLRNGYRGKVAVENDNLTIDYLMNIYGKAMGIKITKEATPSIVALIELVDKKSDKSAKNLKKVYFRKRPYVQLGETTPVPQWEKDSRKSSSYASHHSNLGWALSMVMAEVAPECQDEVLRIGFNYGYDRVIVGYHWASDVEAGRLLAAALVARMHADADFRQLIKQARTEYLKAL